MKHQAQHLVCGIVKEQYKVQKSYNTKYNAKNNTKYHILFQLGKMKSDLCNKRMLCKYDLYVIHEI